MRPTQVLLLLPGWWKISDGAIYNYIVPITPSEVPQYTRTGLGNGLYCDAGGGSGICPDAGWPMCGVNEVYLGATGGATEVYTDQPCPQHTSSFLYHLRWSWVCKPCPAGMKPQLPEKQCDYSGFCVGCSGAGEVLSRNMSDVDGNYDGWTCGPPACGGSGKSRRRGCPIPTSMTTTATTVKPSATAKPKGNCKMTDASAQAILKSEGFSAKFYDKPSRLSIGYGHNCVAHKDCSAIHPPITQLQARALYLSDVREAEAAVKTWPNAKELNLNQFSALCDYTYNVGSGNSIKDWRSYMVAKDWAGMAKVWTSKRVNVVTAPEHDGLVNRRKVELKLFTTPTEVMSGC